MDVIQAILLGILQGLSEFLPISSSGHLVLGKELLGISTADNLAFETLVHCATVMSTITILWKEVYTLIKSPFTLKWDDNNKYITKILVSMIPVMIVGLFFKDQVEQLFGEGIVLVGVMLLVTAILLSLTHFVKFNERKNIGWASAFIIGIGQACAVLPGLSRSGTTIATGLLLGIKKEEMAKFSFLMVLIPILGETFLSIIGGDFSLAESGIAASSLVAGFIAAYIVGCFACKVMIELVKRTSLLWFAAYCLIAGVAALTFGLC